MPILRISESEGIGKLGIWSIEEEEAYFMNRLALSSHERKELEQLTGHGRRLEWLSTRWLVYLLSGESIRSTWRKDDCGKPFVMGSDLHISISHSHGMSAVILAPVRIGIDIQLRVNKIGRLRRKFVNQSENSWLDETRLTDSLHIVWGAKECMYKIYGRRKLDFRTDLFVEPFNMDEPKIPFNGTVSKESHRIDCKLFFENLEPYFLVYGMEKDRTL